MSLIIKKNTTFKIPRTGLFLPSSLGGLALWLKADTGITLQTYISQVVLTCTGGLSSFSGTYIANGFPDAGNNYSLSCPANGKSITCEEGRFYLDQNSNVDSYDCINWNLNNQITVGIHINGGDIPEELGGNYYLNERSAGYSDMINGSGGNIQGSLGNWSLYDTATFTLQYSNSSTYGDGQWTNEAGGGELYGSSVILDPDGTISGTVTRSINYGYQTVIEWADQSGNGIVLTPDIQNAPTLVSSFLNGKPAIEFIVGSNTGLSNTSFGLTGFTFFSVTKQKPTNTGRIFSSYFGNVLIGTWGNYSNRFYGGEGNGWLAEGEDNLTDFLITTAFSDANTTFDFSQNGISNSSGISNSTVILNGISVGGGVWNGGNEEASDSYICEIVIYNRTLTLTERQQVEAYLNQKYQIY